MQRPADPYLNDRPRPRQRRLLRLVVGGLIVGLVAASCVALALIPAFALGLGHDSPRDRAFQVLVASLFAVLGLLLVLTERQLSQVGWSRAPLSFARLLFTSAAGLTFWTGVVLFGLALARLELPKQAGGLNAAFWGLAAFWLVVEVILTARHFWRPRRVQAPGLVDEE